MQILHAGPVDYVLIALYFAFVLAIGVLVSRKMKTSDEFLQAGKSLPAWVTGLAFLSANLGALEVIGMAGSGAEYGLMTAHFYWIGAIPAMVFLGVFMMPFYYGSKARSVPEYLKLRYNEPTRAVNAMTFAVSTLVLSGVSMYGMGLVFHDLLGWNLNITIWLAAAVVLVYTFLGGLTSSIYNEVLQFFLIVLGLTPLVIVGVLAQGGWGHLAAQLPPDFLHTWKGTSSASTNSMHITWPGIVMGLGFALSFGYWCTDFLVIQRALAAKDINAAQRTPLIAAIPKIFFPLLVILPGLIALPLFPQLGHDVALHPENSFNNALPLLMAHYYKPGMLGLGLTALLASFMSGMAGNTTAFNTVFTYDLYQAYLVKGKDDAHYLHVGRMATVFGVLASVGTAYLAESAPSIMDFTQTVFGFVNAPLLGTFLLGMFSKRTTPWGGFWGLIIGTMSAIVHYVLTVKGILHFSTDQAGNFWRAIIAFGVGAIVTTIVSLVTPAKPKAELVGLVYSETKRPEPDHHLPWYERPVILGIVVLALVVFVNILVW